MDEIIALCAEGKRPEASALYKGKGIQATKDVRKPLEALQKESQANADAIYQAIDSDSSAASFTMLAMLTQQQPGRSCCRAGFEGGTGQRKGVRRRAGRGLYGAYPGGQSSAGGKELHHHSPYRLGAQGGTGTPDGSCRGKYQVLPCGEAGPCGESLSCISIQARPWVHAWRHV